MMKRLTWFIGGAAVGAIGAGAAKKKVKSVAVELTPVRVAHRATVRVRTRGQDLTAAIREGRLAMRAKEAELRARMDGTAENLGLDDEVSTVIVDGREVEPGQVIVLRQVREDRSRRRRRA
jgi:hypothetical protein